MENEPWKDEILNSLKGLRRASPDPALYERIRAGLPGRAAMQAVRRPYAVLAAAGFALLLTANVWALTREKSTPSMPSGYQITQGNFDVY